MIEGEDGEVTGYVEKPTLQYEVSMGIYVYDPRRSSTSRRAASTSPTSSWRCVAAGETGARPITSTGPGSTSARADEHERALAAYDQDSTGFDPG